jgi:hypothetical protein
MPDLIKKLDALSDTWKQQFQPPYNEHWTPEHFQTVPDLPLKWTIDKAGIVYLDGLWICPVDQIVEKSLEHPEFWVNSVSIELGLDDGLLSIIILQRHDKYKLIAIERSIFERGTRK